MEIRRRVTKQIKVGDVRIGGDSPVSVQSMTNTKTVDTKSTIEQIKGLERAGCQIVRVAVPDLESAKAIKPIKKETCIPIIADIHFDYKLALESIKAGADGLRLNPGNIGSDLNVRKVVQSAKSEGIPIRIGVNCGSLPARILKKEGLTAEGLAVSALEHVQLLEKEGFYDIKISVKGNSVPLTVDAYRLLSKKVAYPLHIGVTEAGTIRRGTVLSSIGIGILLAEGIGDTIRVSLTTSPVEEVLVGIEILKAFGLRKGLEIVSCPTCGRTEIDIIKMAQEVEKRLAEYKDKPLIVAVMGCEVNGPGEAKSADFGIAGGKKEGLIFSKGKILKKVSEDNLIDELITCINEFYRTKCS